MYRGSVSDGDNRWKRTLWWGHKIRGNSDVNTQCKRAQWNAMEIVFCLFFKWLHTVYTRVIVQSLDWDFPAGPPHIWIKDPDLDCKHESTIGTSNLEFGVVEFSYTSDPHSGVFFCTASHESSQPRGRDPERMNSSIPWDQQRATESNTSPLSLSPLW